MTEKATFEASPSVKSLVAAETPMTGRFSCTVTARLPVTPLNLETPLDAAWSSVAASSVRSVSAAALTVTVCAWFQFECPKVRLVLSSVRSVSACPEMATVIEALA